MSGKTEPLPFRLCKNVFSASQVVFNLCFDKGQKPQKGVCGS